MASKKDGTPSNSLLKNDSTRLRFSVWVIIANFIVGIIGILLGSDLIALGVFLAMSNTPLYAYILGRTFRGETIPDSYYQQQGGSGGLGSIINKSKSTTTTSSWSDSSRSVSGQNEESDNIPTDLAQTTEKPTEVKTVKKDKSEIG